MWLLGGAAQTTDPVGVTPTSSAVAQSLGLDLSQGPISELGFLGQQVTALKARGAGPPQWKAFFEDVYWSLLNTNEFILNH